MSRPVEPESGSLALSELESLKVVDSAGEEVGELIDVVAEFSSEAPVVRAFFIARGDELLAASWAQVAEIDVDGERLPLNCPASALGAASLRAGEIALVDAVLDKQVVDMRDRSFVRVQDVILEARDGDLVVAGVDASRAALARRFGLGFLARRLPRRSGDFVPWQDVNAISLRLSRLNFVEAFAELAELHPADIADVVGQVGRRERAAVLGALDPSLAADTLQEMDDDARVAALAEMPVARAAKILEKLDADVAADLLGDLPDDLAEELLALQGDKRERDLRGLTRHAEDTAGGLMTLEFVAVEPGTTAGDAIDRLRRERPDQHAMSYIYVLGGEGRLAGALSLRELLLADPAQCVDEIMEDDLVTVSAGTDEQEVGRLMTKYNLLAVPVVDDERRLLGIVTLDDALDAILPEDWKHRLPRLFR